MFSLNEIKNFLGFLLCLFNVTNTALSLCGAEAMIIFNGQLSLQLWCLLVIVIILASRFKQEAVMNISKYQILELVTFSMSMGQASYSMPQIISACCWVGQKLGLLSTCEARAEIDSPERSPSVFSLDTIVNFINYLSIFTNVVNTIISLCGGEAMIIFSGCLSLQLWCILVTAGIVTLRFQIISACCWVGHKLGLLSTCEARAELDLPDCSMTTPLVFNLTQYVNYGSMGTSPRATCEKITDCYAEEKIGSILCDDVIEIVVC
ncbi:hypothetical protein DFH28DRAFT_932776 [Melampsora americana]|nr:hypothetical protein DFH28DRAFT_932776 [Melampsora americana]